MQATSILDFLSPGWVGSLIGLAGIAAAVVTYYLTRQRSRLAFRYAGERLLGLSSDGLPTDITVQYRGQQIPRLTRTLVVVWNAGERTILGTDVVPSDQLRLKVEDDSAILAATVLKSTRDVCQLQVGLNASTPHQLDLSFDFLDSGDGAVIEVLHTSEKRIVNLRGTIRGLPNGLDNLGRIAAMRSGQRKFPFPGSPRRLGMIVSVVGILAIVAALLVPWDSLPKSTDSELPVRWIVAGAGALYALPGLALILLTRRRYPKTLHIEELE